MEAVQSATRGSLGYGFVLAIGVAIGVAGFFFPLEFVQYVLISASSVFVLFVAFAYLREMFYSGNVVAQEFEMRRLEIERLRIELYPKRGGPVAFAPEDFCNWIWDWYDREGSWPSVRACVDGHRGWHVATVSEWFGRVVAAGAWVGRVEGGSAGQPAASWNRERFLEAARLANTLV